MKVREIRKILKLRQRRLPKLSLKLGFLIRPLVIITTSIIIAGIYYIGEEIPSLTEGDIALQDIYAPFDFKYKIGIDEEKTKELRERAKNQIGEIYYLKEDLPDEILNKLNEIFSLVSSVDFTQSTSLPQELLKLIPQGISFRSLKELKKYNQKEVLKEISLVLKEYYKNNYVIKDADLENILSAGAEYIYIKRNSGLTQLPPESSQIVKLGKAEKTIVSELMKKFKLRKPNILLNIVSWNLLPNLIFSSQETKALKAQAANKVGDVYIYKEVKKHEKIISEGERIKKEDLAKLREISQRYGTEKFPAGVGMFFFSFLFLSLIDLSFKYFNPKFYQELSGLILVSVVILTVLFLTKIVILSPLPSYITPVAMGGILIGMLISFPVALKVAIFTSVVSGVIIGDNVVPALSFLIGGVTAAIVVKEVRKRSQLLKAGIIVGGMQFFTIMFLGLLFALDINTSLREGANGLIGGIFSVIFALALLPLLEHTFKITTNIRLLELSDLNHPLLKELLIKAPGTYHHSLIVSNLAEQAAEAVVANPLLARVGAYFHDIGKLEKPEYFSENQPLKRKERSRHEKLSPSMSSLIIINHVKKGLELARKYKLPPAIVDFIEQHHGRSLVYYFYHKALEIKSEGEIKEEQFRYPGPKPQTKEVAIVSLADAVEAATRSLQEPTPARIKGLIKEIINNKFAAGELDECELTLKDLNKIAEVFTRLSLSVHHVRVEYPGEKKQD